MSWLKRHLHTIGFVSLITIYLFLALADWREDSLRAPPEPRWRSALVVPEAPPRLARTYEECSPTFTPEERQRLFERCARDGGRTRTYWGEVQCRRADEGREFYEPLWTLRAAEYPLETHHAELPAWARHEGATP